MSLPVFAVNQPLSANAVNRLDEAIDDLADRAMSCAVPQLVVNVLYERAKRGYVIHRHYIDTYAHEVLVYDLLVAGVGSGKKVRVSYHGSTLYEFDGSDSAHGNGHKRGYWSLHEFPTAGTHPADGEWVQVDIEVIDGDVDVSCAIYTLREGLLEPAGYVLMEDPDSDVLLDEQCEAVPADMQTIADNVLALQGLSHSRVAGFWPQELEHGLIIENTVFTVGTWRWPTNKGDLLYYSLRVFKENEGIRGGDTFTTVKVYVQPQADPAATLVGTFYAGGKDDPDGGRRGDRFYEGTLDISAVTRYQNEPCIVTVTVQFSGGSGTGYGGCTVYMLREESAYVPGMDAFTGVEYAEYVEGHGALPALRDLWTNVKERLAADDGADGYGADGLDVAGGFPHGYALLWYSNPVMFGGAQQNEILGDTMTEVRFIRTNDVLYYAVEGDAELVYTDVDGNEATRQLDARVALADLEEDDERYYTLALSDIDDLSNGAGFAVRCVAESDPAQSAMNMIYGAWLGDAE